MLKLPSDVETMTHSLKEDSNSTGVRQPGAGMKNKPGGASSYIVPSGRVSPGLFDKDSITIGFKTEVRPELL